MRKRNILILWIMILFAFSCETPVDWSETFDSKNKIPFGTYVLRSELDSLFPYSDIINIDENTSEFFNTSSDFFDTNNPNLEGNYVYINQEIILDSLTQIELEQFANKGNLVFISSYQLPTYAFNLGSLTVKKPFDNGIKYNKTQSAHKVIFQTSIDNVSNQSISYGNTIQANYFENIPPSAEILGTVTYNNVTKPNYIKFAVGDGFLLLHAEPFAFTNFEMLQSNHSIYVENVFSAFNDYTIYWDNDRMYQRKVYGKQQGGFWNLVNFFLEHKELKMAIYLFLFGLLVYLLFNSRRKQKAIPLVSEYKNSQLEFSKLVTQLYAKDNNYKHLLLIRLHYLLDEIRRKYKVNTSQLSPQFAILLSKKSGFSEFFCQELIRKINHFQLKDSISKDEFMDTSRIINQFLYSKKNSKQNNKN